MPQPLLHHYGLSPFSEKVRLALGLKGLAWGSVDISPVPPRPLLEALTGGYRRVPVLQIGADIYCDTGIILPALERLRPSPTLYPKGSEGLAQALAFAWERFAWIPAIGVLVHFIGNLPPEFIKDRKDSYLYIDISKDAMEPQFAANVQRLHALLAPLQAALADGRAYLFGTQPSAADLAYFQVIWLIRKNSPPAEVDALLGLQPLLLWYERMLSIGHGRPEAMSAEQALAVARDAAPAPPAHLRADGDPGGLRAGTRVTVTPEDNARIPVAGTLVAADATEVVIHRRDAQAGDLHLHFPRAGFEVAPA